MTYDERIERRNKTTQHSADYANLGGASCPTCGAAVTMGIVSGAKTREHSLNRGNDRDRRILLMYYGPLVCDNCGFEWHEKFMLIGYHVETTK